MLDKLFNMLKTDFTLSHMASVLSQVENLISMFEANNLKDGNTKDAAIDTLVELMQSQKSTSK